LRSVGSCLPPFVAPTHVGTLFLLSVFLPSPPPTALPPVVTEGLFFDVADDPRDHARFLLLELGGKSLYRRVDRMHPPSEAEDLFLRLQCKGVAAFLGGTRINSFFFFSPRRRRTWSPLRIRRCEVVPSIAGNSSSATVHRTLIEKKGCYLPLQGFSPRRTLQGD